MNKSVLAIAAFVLLGCSKPRNTTTTTTTPVDESTSLTGSWKLVLITGGIAGMHQAPGPGQNKHVTFRGDGTCTTVFATDTTNTTYSLRVDTATSYGTLCNFLTIGDNDQMIYRFAHDTLTIEMDGIVDGTSDWMVRD